MNNLEFQKCIICESDNLETVTNTGQFDLTCNVKICKNDGLVFLSPRWSKSEYLKFYKNDYDKYYRPEVFSANIDSYFYKESEKVVERLTDLINTKRKLNILDVGCGMGWVLDIIHEKFSHHKFFAIEASEYCCNSILSRNFIDIISNDVDKNWENSYFRKFDLIILRHTLEHFIDPLLILEKMKRALTEDGLLYIAVPDMNHVKGSLQLSWFRSVHVFYFNIVTLNVILNKSGFQVIKYEEIDSEIWCLCSSSNLVKNSYDLHTNYLSQIFAIKKLIKKDMPLMLGIKFSKLLKIILPKKLFSYLQKIYRKALVKVK